MSRDPIEGKGGLSLYNFVNNQTVNIWDNLGLRGDANFQRNYQRFLSYCREQCRSAGDSCHVNCCKGKCGRRAIQYATGQAPDEIYGDGGGTYSAGVVLSGVAGGGGVVQFGVYYNSAEGEVGGYVSLGGGVGANISAGVEAGYMNGPLSNFEGTSVTGSGSIPSGASGSVTTSIQSGATGGYGGWGLGTPTIAGGGSATIEQTGCAGLRF